MLATHCLICFSSLFLSLECFEGFGSLFSCPHLSHAKEISNKLQEWNWVPLRWNFFFTAPREFNSGGGRGPAYQATGQVWGLTAWLQTIMNPLYKAQLPLRSAGVREGSCSNQMLLHATEWKVSLSSSPKSRSFLSVLYAILLCRVWLLVSFLSPSFPNSGRAHLLPRVTHSVNKHVVCSYLVPSPWQSPGRPIPAPVEDLILRHPGLICTYLGARALKESWNSWKF